jgi:hypothetical protein
VFFLIFGSSTEIKVCETTEINGDVALSLVQPRVKNARTLTVKGMMKNWWNLNSEVTNYSP